jgi:predicted metalloprotease with PDZ domain
MKIKSFFDRYVRGTVDLPLDKWYADFGVVLQDQRKISKPGLGVKYGREGNDCKLAQVFSGGAAHLAGLSAGDVVIAIEGLRVTAADVATDLSKLLGRYSVNSKVEVHVFRRDELMKFTVCLQSDDVPMWSLQLKEAKKEGGVKSKSPPELVSKVSTYLRRPGM